MNQKSLPNVTSSLALAPFGIGLSVFGICKFTGTPLIKPSIAYTGLVTAGTIGSLVIINHDRSDRSVAVVRKLISLFTVGAGAYMTIGYWSTLWGIHRGFYFIRPHSMTHMQKEIHAFNDFRRFMKDKNL